MVAEVRVERHLPGCIRHLGAGIRRLRGHFRHPVAGDRPGLMAGGRFGKGQAVRHLAATTGQREYH